MGFEGVLISFKINENQNAYYGCGILINSDLVLVPGSVLLEFTQDEGWVPSFLKSVSKELIPSPSMKKILFRVFLESKGETREGLEKLNFFESRITLIWKCPAVSESVKKLFSEWTLGHVSSIKGWEIPSGVDTEMPRELMSIFILLRRENRLGECNSSDDERVLASLLPSLEEPTRGQRVEIVSTPFGNEYFMNSLSQGIVSNVAGINKCIILSDARTTPGCEGGPIFASKKPREKERKLIGQVICSLSWWRGEWVGLTIGINLTPVLKTFLKRFDPRRIASSFRNELSNSDLLPLCLVDETVVLIRSETCWGSGIVLNATSGVIITCSHVVKNDKTVFVLYKAKPWPANVIFRTRNDLAYDLAIIKTTDSFIFQKQIEFSEYPAEIGDAVLAAGFPFFSEKDDLHIKPTVVHGSVAKVNPYMIQTTCCIQSGFSGGALFKNGKLLGIIVSNAIDSTAGAYFPHVNFIIPSSIFKNPILKYIRQNDTESLKELESSSSRAQLLWKLQTSKL